MTFTINITTNMEICTPLPAEQKGEGVRVQVEGRHQTAADAPRERAKLDRVLHYHHRAVAAQVHESA